MCSPSKASGALPRTTQSIWFNFMPADSSADLAASHASSFGVSSARRMNLVIPAPTTATLRRLIGSLRTKNDNGTARRRDTAPGLRQPEPDIRHLTCARLPSELQDKLNNPVESTCLEWQAHAQSAAGNIDRHLAVSLRLACFYGSPELCSVGEKTQGDEMLQFLIGIGIVDFEQLDRLQGISNRGLAVGFFRGDANIIGPHPIARFQGSAVIGKSNAADPGRLRSSDFGPFFIGQDNNRATVRRLSNLRFPQRIGDVGRGF